jgi:hypothetical protein
MEGATLIFKKIPPMGLMLSINKNAIKSLRPAIWVHKVQIPMLENVHLLNVGLITQTDIMPA